MPAEETTSREARGRSHETPPRSPGQCVFIGALALGLISGLGAGVTFGMMTDEVIDLLKDPNASENAEHEFVELRSALESSYVQGFLIVMILTYIGILLGFGAYNFLISINEEENTAITGAASVALLVISVSGAATGAICSKYSLPVIVNFILFMLVICIILVHFRCKVEIVILESVLWLFLLTYGHIWNAAFLGFYSGITRMFIYLTILGILVIAWYIYYKPIQNDLSNEPGLALWVLQTGLFLVGTDRAAKYAPDQGLLIRVLLTQLTEVAMGNVVYLMYSFLLGPGDGIWSGKVCAYAVAHSAAVLVAIQNSSPMVSTWARLWALAGVSGSAGVALAAAGDLGQTYGEKLNQVRWGGILGRGAAILGAAAGAFFTEGTENLSYGFFKAFCAATISGTPLAKKIPDILFPGLHDELRGVWERIWQSP